MADKARKWTDKELRKIEKKLEKIYSDALDDIEEEWDEYLLESNIEIKQLEDELKKAKQGSDKKKIAILTIALVEAKKRFTLGNKEFQKVAEKVAYKITRVNMVASDFMNSKRVDIYKVNYNQAETAFRKIRHAVSEYKDTAIDIGIKFDVINPHTIAELKAGNIKLPPRKINVAKDMMWNTKKLNSAVLQGILNGEAIPTIASRIRDVVDANTKASIRTARTMVTQAENAGRYDSYRELEQQGAILNKVWLATHDGRTRAWHLDMDMQTVPLNDYFIDGLGNELEYPADPDAEPETVYNCRCSMTTEVVGIRARDGSIIPI